MTWIRTDDNFTDWPVFESLDFAARWHYLALIHLCGRTFRYDGRLRAVDVRRASDVPDPDACTEQLIVTGLVTRDGDGYKLARIDEHMPPPSMRDGRRKESQRDRQRRARLHKQGNHCECLPENCDAATAPDAPVTSEVTRDPGTGQVPGTGLAAMRTEFYTCVCGEPAPSGEQFHPACADSARRCALCLTTKVAGTKVRGTDRQKVYCDPCFAVVRALLPSLSTNRREITLADLTALLRAADEREVADVMERSLGPLPKARALSEVLRPLIGRAS